MPYFFFFCKKKKQILIQSPNNMKALLTKVKLILSEPETYFKGIIEKKYRQRWESVQRGVQRILPVLEEIVGIDPKLGKAYVSWGNALLISFQWDEEDKQDIKEVVEKVQEKYKVGVKMFFFRLSYGVCVCVCVCVCKQCVSVVYWPLQNPIQKGKAY